MALKDRLNKISSYFKGIDYQGGLLIIKVSFPEQVTPVGSEDELIKVTHSDDGLWYYYGDADLVDEDSIFDLIENTVSIYEEAKQKVTLLKAKVNELRELFANTPLKDLERLRFVIAEETTTDKPKRQYNRKKKNMEETVSEQETVTEEAHNIEIVKVD